VVSEVGFLNEATERSLVFYLLGCWDMTRTPCVRLRGPLARLDRPHELALAQRVEVRVDARGVDGAIGGERGT